MTTPYTIPHTAQNISDAITQVVNADSTPQSPSQNMVTSEGVKAYVDGAVTGLTTGSFAATTLVTESDAIASNDNDTTIPTSAAVKDFVDTTVSNSVSYALYELYAATNFINTTVIPVTETADPNNIGSVSNGTITLGAGTYSVIFQGEYAEEDNDVQDKFTIQHRIGNFTYAEKEINETGSSTTFVGFTSAGVVHTDTTETVEIKAVETPSSSMYSRYVKILITKLA